MLMQSQRHTRHYALRAPRYRGPSKHAASKVRVVWLVAAEGMVRDGQAGNVSAWWFGPAPRLRPLTTSKNDFRTHSARPRCPLSFRRSRNDRRRRGNTITWSLEKTRLVCYRVLKMAARVNSTTTNGSTRAEVRAFKVFTFSEKA